MIYGKDSWLSLELEEDSARLHRGAQFPSDILYDNLVFMGCSVGCLLTLYFVNSFSI